VARRPLDDELLRRGLATDREDARRAVRGGFVTVRGSPVRNAASMVASDEPVDRAGERVGESDPYVSRGGDKLEAALAHFAVDVAGTNALDAGASTGGFTDCLLRHGAARVIAVDVGYGDLAWSLRRDPRVHVLERTNVRDLRPDSLPFRPTVVVADLSFISLRTVISPLTRVAADRAMFVMLVKPQFEAPRRDVPVGGVIRDRAVWRSVLEDVTQACRSAGLEPRGLIPSPLLGPAGNVEFLLVADTERGASRAGIEQLGAEAAIATATEMDGGS
jgi:23S rRNA (cytidine1920-2'-O)/16S rRNA (cytidine1409-2'-O)-methyltransferase